MELFPSDIKRALRILPDITIAPKGNQLPPGRRVVVLRDGRFLASDTAAAPGTVTLWTPKGEYETSAGRQGDRYIEFGDRGRLVVAPAADDGFYVRDGYSIWWRLNAHLNVVGRHHRPEIGTLSWAQAYFQDGIVVSTQRMPGAHSRGFRQFNIEQGSQIDFGPDIDVEAALAPGTSDAFWAAWTHSEGYTLQLWDLTGRRRTKFTRSFTDPERAWLNAPVRISMIHCAADSQVIIYVVPRVERDRLGHRDESSMTMLMDVIDVDHAQIACTTQCTVTGARRTWPTFFFAGQRRGYKYLHHIRRAEVVTYDIRPVV